MYFLLTKNFSIRRRPSWTDRILYRVNADIYDDIRLSAIQRNYKSHSNYIQSDHKPVTGEFDIIVRFALCSTTNDPLFYYKKFTLYLQIRPHVEDHGVEFQPVSSWFIDEENSVSYKLLGDARPASGDWVGLFHNEFSSLDEYIVYEYVGRGKTSVYHNSLNTLIDFCSIYTRHSYLDEFLTKIYVR